MASPTLIPFPSYSNYSGSFQQTKGRYKVGLRSGEVIPSTTLSLQNHKGRLRPTQHPTVICSRQSKSETVTWKTWEKLVLKNEKAVVVEFYASWYGPCQMVHRVMEEIAEEYKGKLECFVLNTDSDMAAAEEYDVRAVPVVVLFNNGNKFDSIVGTMPKDFYVAAIDKLLASSS